MQKNGEKTMREDIFCTGLFCGLLLGAVFNNFVYFNILEQRDYWKDAYCHETSLQLVFCKEE